MKKKIFLQIVLIFNLLFHTALAGEIPDRSPDKIFIKNIEINPHGYYGLNQNYQFIKNLQSQIANNYSEYFIIDAIEKNFPFQATFNLTINEEGAFLETTLEHLKDKRKFSTQLPDAGFHFILTLAAEDLFALWAADTKNLFRPVNPPPRPVSIVKTNTIAEMNGWRREDDHQDQEYITVKPSDFGTAYTLFTERGFITIDKYLRPLPRTAEDLLLQKKHPLPHPVETINAIPSKEIVITNFGGNLFIPGKTKTIVPSIDDDDENEFTSIEYLESYYYTARDNQNNLVLLELTDNRLKLKEILFSAKKKITTTNHKGKIWCFFHDERRLKVFNVTGNLIKTLRPLLPPEKLPFPQIIAVDAADNIFIGGSGILWKFDSRGFPQWEMTGIAGESLPAYYSLAASKADPSAFALADPLKGRLIAFGETETGPGKELWEKVFPLNPENREDIVQKARYYLAQKMYFNASQYATLLKTESLELNEKILIRKIETDYRKEVTYFLSLQGDNYYNKKEYEAAEAFYKEAFDRFRALREEDPTDIELPGLLEEMNRKRKNVTKLLNES